jgi:hypothetical protein
MIYAYYGSQAAPGRSRRRATVVDAVARLASG